MSLSHKQVECSPGKAVDHRPLLRRNDLQLVAVQDGIGQVHAPVAHHIAKGGDNDAGGEGEYQPEWHRCHLDQGGNRYFTHPASEYQDKRVSGYHDQLGGGEDHTDLNGARF